MTTISDYIKRFPDWFDKLGEDLRRYGKNPNTQHSHYSPSPNARKKAVKIVDALLFGIGKKKKK